MADAERPQQQHSPDDDQTRGTSAPAVGGTKTEKPSDAADEETRGEPPTNAGGKTTNNPEVGPSS